jgi:hypothetical protein
MSRKQKLILIVPLGILGMAGFIALGGWIVEELWNWLAPALFGWRQITFWQGFGLLALCRILFGGWGGGYRGGMRRRMKDRMEERMGKRWEAMTPEERERFRQGMRSRCGFGPPASESKPAE